MGNDDAGILDEDANPYEAQTAVPGLEHEVGAMTSTDRPFLNFDPDWGQAGAKLKLQVKFREFARLELWDGEREGDTWFRVSDYHDWHYSAESEFNGATGKWEDDGTSTGNGHAF